MRVCLLLGSTKPNGNTEELCKPFIEELKAHQVEVDYITLYDKQISPCIGCFTCQKTRDSYGCAIQDDMQAVIDSIVKADVLVMATPIYTWQAATPLKSVMDRMLGLIKLKTEEEVVTLNAASQPYALITTCGDDISHGTGPLEQCMKYMCEYSNRPYLGMYAFQDINGISDFRTPEAIQGAKDFAQKVIRFQAS